ncbi:MAG TPA: 5'-3' exonuclease H3TH domain-containing protein [Kineosporiaceae bacterium]
MPPAPAPLLLVIDGDSLLHRAHHAMAGSEQRDAEGRPAWALRGLVGFIATAAARLTPDGLIVGFDCREHSVRRAEHPEYKAHRADKHPDLQAQLEAAPELLAEAGITVVVRPGYEADDVLASAAALARRSRWRSTLVTSDRDSFALLDETTSVLRVLNGGLDASPVLTPATLEAVCGVPPDRYRDLAALRGDTSDNLPGVPGIGGKTAARLLCAFGSVEGVYAALDGGRAAEVVEVVGELLAGRLAEPSSRQTVERNRRLMAMRDDLRMPSVRRASLPLDPARMRAALGARGIGLGPSLWALVGEPPPAWLQAGYDRAPSYLPRVDPPHVTALTLLPAPGSGSASQEATAPGGPAGVPARGPAGRSPGRPAAPRRRRQPVVVPESQLALF